MVGESMPVLNSGNNGKLYPREYESAGDDAAVELGDSAGVHRT